jgi:hypothetical protein
MIDQMANSRIRLLEPDEYDRIVREGRAAEVLATYVRRKAGRRALSGEAKTTAERQREWRERQRQKREAAGTGGDQ